MKLSHLSVQKDREAYLRGLVDLCSQAVESERCTVYVVDKEHQELVARVAQRTTTEIRLPLGTRNIPSWRVGGGAGKPVGVIQALNKRDGTFERRDQMLLEQIAETVAPV